MYFLYILECSDGTLYTGITLDLERRLAEHNSSILGAKYTKNRRPVTLAYFEKLANRSLAAKREYFIKHLKRAAKLALIKKSPLGTF